MPPSTKIEAAVSSCSIRRVRPLLFLLSLLSLDSLSADVLLTMSTPSGETIDQLVPSPALFRQAEQPPSPFLESGPFEATFTGELTLAKRERLFFSFRGRGQATLTIDEKEILTESGELGGEKTKRLRLNSGAHSFRITYHPPAEGSPQFRLFWEGRDFAPEPVPATLLSHSQTKPPLDLDQARGLFAQQGCIHCHQPEAPLGPKAMPELSRRGPDLTAIGSRVTTEWLTRWLAQPDLLKSDSRMPALLDHTTAEGAQQAADLAAYLSTLQKPETSVKKESENAAPTPKSESKIKSGAHLFHQLGCIACHSLPSNHIPEAGFIPLNNTATKYQAGALAAFLLQPNAHDASIRMPNFGLSTEEAESLAAWLRSESTGRHTPDPSEFPPGDSLRGKELTQQLHCASCHDGMPAPTYEAPPLAEIAKVADWSQKGCFAPAEKRGHAPRLLLKSEAREPLADLVKNHLPSLKRTVPAHYALREIQYQNCAACHQNNQHPSLLSERHALTLSLAHHGDEEEKVDQSRPQLTYLGEMLQSDYLANILAGTENTRPRPWLGMRMPAFHLDHHQLAEGLAQLHGLPPSQPDPTPADAEQALIGKDLISLQGLACVTCHGVGDQKPVSAFEVLGINFDQTHHRLRKSYFLRWLRNPQRITPSSKMPAYTLPTGEALRQDILDGDASKQFEAIWEYLKQP